MSYLIIKNYFTGTIDFFKGLYSGLSGNYGELLGDKYDELVAFKDEKLADEGILKFPLCSIVYYSCVKSLLGGRLYVEDDIITPKTNRMIIFAAGARHYVEDFSGHRVSMLINPWDRYVSVN